MFRISDIGFVRKIDSTSFDVNADGDDDDGGCGCDVVTLMVVVVGGGSRRLESVNEFTNLIRLRSG